MATPDPPPYDSPAVFCRHLLICRTLWYDAANPDDGYSLARIVVNVRPPAGSDGQFVEPRLFAYVQLCGTVGEYEARLKLVHVTVDDAGDELERELAEWGLRLIPVTGIDLAESTLSNSATCGSTAQVCTSSSSGWMASMNRSWLSVCKSLRSLRSRHEQAAQEDQRRAVHSPTADVAVEVTARLGALAGR